MKSMWNIDCIHVVIIAVIRANVDFLVLEPRFSPCAQFNICSYLFTYSMVQSPSWAANWFAASQEIPRISRNPKVHHRTHKRTPPVSILGQPNPVHIPTSHLLEIHPNIIHPSTPRSPQWSPSLRFPQQDPVHPPLFRNTHLRFLWKQLINLYPCLNKHDSLKGCEEETWQSCRIW